MCRNTWFYTRYNTDCLTALSVRSSKLYVTVHAKRGIFAYATEIVFLLSFERVSVVLANGAIGSVIDVTDPKLRHFETEPLPNSICKTAFLPFS